MGETEQKSGDNNRKVEEDTLSQNYNNAISHFYRGEMQRTYNWRKRLDKTTNWAIVIIAATLTWTFSNEASLHFVLLISLFFIMFLSVIESRRYAVYVVWKSRVRVLEENFLAPLLSGDKKKLNGDWKNILAEDLLEPAHKIGSWEAFSRRLRRIYDWLFLGIIAAWIAKLSIHPTTASSIGEIIQRAKIGPISGNLVFTFVILFLIGITVISLYRWNAKYGIKDREAKGHLKPKEKKEKDWREV